MIVNPAKSAKFYKLGASSSTDIATKTKNKAQKCKLILDVDKDQSELFQDYDMKLGLIVYEDEDSTTYKQLVNKEDETTTLSKPVFTMKPVAKSTFENVEVGEEKVEAKKNTAGEAEKVALSLDASAVVEQDVDIKYMPVKEQDIPDLLQVTFKTKGPNAMVKDGDGMFQFFSFRVKGSSDPYTTVGCYTEVGDSDGSKSEVIAWESADKFDSTTKADKSLANMKSDTAPITRAE